MKKSSVLLSTMLAVGLSGCGPKAPQAAPYAAPIVDVAAQTPSVPDVDPATISPHNYGYDVVVSNVRGHLILKGPKLYWKTAEKDAVEVLKIKGDLIAYNVVLLRPDDEQISLIYYTTDRKGYSCRCYGLMDNGLPFFGEPKLEADLDAR